MFCFVQGSPPSMRLFAVFCSILSVGHYSKLPPPKDCHLFYSKTPSGILWGGSFFVFFFVPEYKYFLSSTAFVTKSILCCQPGTGIYPKNMKVFILNAIYVFFKPQFFPSNCHFFAQPGRFSHVSIEGSHQNNRAIHQLKSTTLSLHLVNIIKTKKSIW